MAIDPLLSQATSRVVEAQRGSGDEKRRQDLAAAFISRIADPGERGFVAGKSGEEQPAAVSDQGSRRAGRFVGQDEAGQRQPTGDEATRQPFPLDDAPGRAIGNQRILFASVGFSAQQISEEQTSIVQDKGDNAQAGALQANQAYSSAQNRATPHMPGFGPQVVTESGMMMGFGAYDSRARFDVQV